MIRKLVLIFIFLLLTVGCAQAGISYKWTSQIVIEDMPDCDIQDVYDALSPANGDLLLYPDPVDPTIWYVNRTILVDRSNFTLSPERGVSEIRIDNQLGGQQEYSMHGTPGAANGIIMDGITYTGWDMLNNTPRENLKRNLQISKGNINNAVFKNISQVYVYNTYNKSLDNITIYNSSEMAYRSSTFRIDGSNDNTITNLSFYDSVGTLVVTNSTHNYFENIYAENIEWYGIGLTTGSHYNTFRNVSVINFGDYLNYRTDSGAFYTKACNYTTGYNFYLNGSPWSTLAPGGYFGYYENITVINSGHNSIDLHNVRDSVFVNCTLIAPSKNEPYPLGKTKGVNNVLLTGGEPQNLPTANITMRDIICYNAGISAQTGADHLYLSNVTIYGEGASMYVSADYFMLKNYTITPNTDELSNPTIILEIKEYKVERSLNNLFIDGTFNRLSAIHGNRTRLLNTKYNGGSYKNHTEYYYGDVAVKDGAGTLLSGTVTFANENTTDAKFSSTDGLAENKQTFNVTSGRTLLPDSNRFDSAAIADTWNDPNNTVIQFEQTVTVDTPQGSVILTDINPDPRWYRTNPQQSKYTITAIINTSENLHFIGYAPTPEYNIFKTGDSVKFQIWTNEPLTSVTWKKDGQTLQTGGMTYEATISDVPITVDILGESASGSISKTWVVDPTPPEEPNTTSLIPVANFTANTTSGTYPMWVSFSDESENTPLRWYWDFDNDGVTDSRLENPVYKYKTTGNYTVKLTVANDAENGIDSETKTAYITVTGATPTKSVTHSIYGYFYNMFYRIFYLGAWL